MKNRLKSLFCLMMMGVLLTGLFAGCNKKEDWDYLADKKKVIIGITLYEPMNYYDKDDKDKLVGFDTEFTEAVCEILGLEPTFQVIDWNMKENELKSKSIDLIWNGLTVSDERRENMDFSLSYLINKQVAVIKTENKDNYKGSTASMKGAKMAAEQKSAGQTAIEADSVLKTNPFTAVVAQSNVLLEVKSGTVDVGVIDLVMAQAMIGENTDYSDLMIAEGIELTQEEYAIGMRKDSKITAEKINDAIKKLAEDGTLMKIAKKYGLEQQLSDQLNVKP